MKKIYLFGLFILVFYSCKKSVEKTNVPKGSYYVEDFRKPGMSDYETIMAAYDSLPNFSKIIFSKRTYILSHTPILYKALDFYGPAILKREDQIIYTLKEPADEFSKMIILNSVDGIMPGDNFLLAFGKSSKEGSFTNSILKINGDTLFLNEALAKTEGGIGYYPIGTKLLKNINLFWVHDGSLNYSRGCSFNDLTFDGNRDNNNGSYSWRINSAIMAVTKSTTKYLNCKFINSPAETIVGHNADIRDCTFYNINGSAFHASADRLTSTESEIHSYLVNNTFENTNQIPDSIGGHSEGCITHSNSGGYYTATGNSFINVGHAVLGTLYPSVSINDWGTSNITFTGNLINGADRIVQSIAMLPGVIHDVRIDSNTIYNMPSFDWTPALNFFSPGIILKDKSGE